MAKRKSDWRRLRDLCDDLCSMAVRARDNRRYGGICPLCQRRPIQCAFHFIGRAAYAVRYHLDNVFGACSECNHMEMLYRSAAARERWRMVHISLIGLERREALEALARGPAAKFTVSDLEELAAAFKRMIKDAWRCVS